MAKVTVALNCYNGMPYLPAAVESILAQTLQDFELIVVNDGSTDDSRDYLESLDDPRIRVIHQENGGCSAASNRAIQECRTEYLARMDADDLSLPERLELQLAFMEEHPEVGMVGTQPAWFGEKSTGSSIKLPTTHDAIWKALVGGHHAMCHATLMMRTNVIRSAGGYWQYRNLDDDTDMMLRMGETTQLANLDRTLYHYRMHQGSLCASSIERVRFSYNYSIELSRRRSKSLPLITPDEYRSMQDARAWPHRMLETLDLHARYQYRLAVEEIFGDHPVRGRARLAYAAACSPKLTLQRIRRMVRRTEARSH